MMVPTTRALAPTTPQGYLAAAEAHPVFYLDTIVIGVGLDCILMGIILGQLTYWQTNVARHDHWLLWCLVYFIVLCVLTQSGLVLAAESAMLVQRYGDLTVLLNGRWIKWIYAIETAISVPIRGFYAHRAWRLWERSYPVLVTTCTLIVTNLALGIALQLVSPTDYLHVESTPTFYAWVSSLVVTEWVFFAFMLIPLIRTSTGFVRTELLLRDLVLLSAETQLLPGIIVSAFLFKSIIAPTSPVTYLFSGLPKLSTIACMMVIISRQRLRAQVEQERERRQNTFDLGLAHLPVLPIQNPEETFLNYLSAHSDEIEEAPRSVPNYEIHTKPWSGKIEPPSDLVIAYVEGARRSSMVTPARRIARRQSQ